MPNFLEKAQHFTCIEKCSVYGIRLNSSHKKIQPITFKYVASVKQLLLSCCNDDFILKKFSKLLLTRLRCASQTALRDKTCPART